MQQMGLKLVSMPDPLHGGVADSCMSSHRARGPVGCLHRGALQRVLDDAPNELVGVVAFATSPRLVAQALEALLCKAPAPIRDGGLAGVENGGDVATFLALSSEQDDTSSKHIP